MSNEQNIHDMKGRMAEVEKASPTMCLAKWLQSTVLLYNGHTHSCHHPAPHKIPLSEIKASPTALHNTKHKKKAREQMLRGERPSECQYCWNIEDLSVDHISDRTYKSADLEWAYPNMHSVIKAGADGDIAPTYLEVAFESTCNFKCVYCSPDVSSKWMEEIKEHGAYPTSGRHNNLEYIQRSGKTPMLNREDNPYIDAFWEWWPKLYPNLKTFRITGGEPLLSKHTWKVLDYIKENPNPELNLAINTNLGVPEASIERLISYYHDLYGTIKSFDIYTSCEATGAQAEYIRYGMNYESFIRSVTDLLRWTTHLRVHMMMTVNKLSFRYTADFLADVIRLRQTYNIDDSYNRIPLMVNYVRWPDFLSPQADEKPFSNVASSYMKTYMEGSSTLDKPGRFYLEEYDQMCRLEEFVQEALPEQERLRRHQDRKAYLEELDRRRNTDYKNTFNTVLT